MNLKEAEKIELLSTDIFCKVDVMMTEAQYRLLTWNKINEIITALRAAAKPESAKVISAGELLGSFDADKWAKEFMRVYNGYSADAHWVDLDLMRAWFANALMAGHDFANRNNPDTIWRRRVTERAERVRKLEGGKTAGEMLYELLGFAQDIKENKID